jgi:NADH:ubiquinone oxidoreductase subunit 3 (subunit A)
MDILNLPNVLLSPPVAFLAYIPLVLLFVWLGKTMAGPGKPSDIKSSVYGSGEEAPTYLAAPGYKPFFLIAFFFAILHLGMLVLGSGGLTATAGIYLGGMLLALLALILG